MTGGRCPIRLGAACSVLVLFFVATSGPCIFHSSARAAELLTYELDTGDRIRVTVFGHEDLSGEFEIDGSGRVSLPLISQIKASGLTLREIERDITNKLKPDFLKNPRVSVDVLNYRPFYIIGEVKKPGSYSYVNGMTIVNAVALAGGYTYRARENNVLITRATDPEKSQQPADHLTTVLPGDVIEVPERYW